MKGLYLLVFALLAVIALSGCVQPKTANKLAREEVEAYKNAASSPAPAPEKTSQLNESDAPLDEPEAQDFDLQDVNETFANDCDYYKLHMVAYRVSDSNGGRAARITPDVVEKWVNNTNRMFEYSNASIYLEFNPESDFKYLYSDQLSKLMDNPSIGIDEANSIADQYPDSIVFFFRWGHEDAGPTGGGFSWPDYTRFIALPGYDTTEINPCVFCHELGHYMSLVHTFPNDYLVDTPEKIESYIAEHGSLDADGLSDTPWDVGPRFYRNQGWGECDPAHASFTAGDTTITPDRHNFMGYYNCGYYTASPQQIKIIYQTLETRKKSLIEKQLEQCNGKINVND